MDNRYVVERKKTSQYNITHVIIDYDTETFVIHIKGYKKVELLFLEIESFISEYDEKLFEYLQCKDTLEDKIHEATEIGYDFSPMVAELLKSFIEYGLICPTKE